MTTVIVIKFHFILSTIFTLSIYTPCIHHPKCCITISLQFLLGIMVFPWEIKDKACAKFWGVNKVYYGQCENGEYSCGDRLGGGKREWSSTFSLGGGDLVNAQTWHVLTLEILDGPPKEGVEHSYHAENNPSWENSGVKFFKLPMCLPQSTVRSAILRRIDVSLTILAKTLGHISDVQFSEAGSPISD